MVGFKFRYNEFEKPSSKSYMAPIIKELEITKYLVTLEANSSKVAFKVWIKGRKEDISEIAEEQLKLYLMNKHSIENYSDISLTIIGSEETNIS